MSFLPWKQKNSSWRFQSTVTLLTVWTRYQDDVWWMWYYIKEVWNDEDVKTHQKQKTNKIFSDFLNKLSNLLTLYGEKWLTNMWMWRLTSRRAKKRMRRIPQQSMERPNRSTSGWYWQMQENLRYSASFFSSCSFSRYFPLAGMAITSYRGGIAGVNKDPRRAGVCVSTTFLGVWEQKEKSTVLYLLGAPR